MRTAAIVVLGLALSVQAHAAVLCAKPKPDGSFDGSVKIRTACKPRETQLDPVDLGLQGPQGVPGPPGETGATGAPGPAGAPGPGLVVKDANGAFVGVVNSVERSSPISPNVASQVYVMRRLGSGTPVLLPVSNLTGFLGSDGRRTGPLYYESTDCSGPPLMAVSFDGSLIVDALVRQQSSGAPLIAYYPVGPPLRTFANSFRYDPSGGAGCATVDVNPPGMLADVATTDLTALGLIPPFHVEGP